MKMLHALLWIFILFPCLNQYSFAQQNEHHCGQHILLKQMLEDSAFKKQFEADQALLNQQLNNSLSQKGVVYTIPVVFHIVHNNGVEKIDRDQVYDALAILNRDLRALRADTATVDSLFKPLIADVEVEFALATKAPNGTCFSGVTYTETVFSYNNGNINGSDQLNACLLYTSDAADE